MCFLLNEKKAYEDDLRRLKDERDKNVKAAPDRFRVADYEPRIKRLESLIKQKGNDFTNTREELYSRAEKYRRRRNHYISLKTDEGIVSLTKIVFMVASIIALLVGPPLEAITGFLLWSIVYWSDRSDSTSTISPFDRLYKVHIICLWILMLTKDPLVE